MTMKTGMEGEKVMVMPESRRKAEATSIAIFRPNLNFEKRKLDKSSNGQQTKTETRRKRPTTKQISDSRRTPTPIPDTADIVDIAVMLQRVINCKEKIILSKYYTGFFEHLYW